ncbi:UNVERIFIED_CONTAM: hypothetical protein GTU68_032763 [Idotea baltica]|nr:hypothetical protein [Idotea baltica]
MLETVMSLNFQCHVLVVDDNSPDGTADLVKIKIEKYPNRLFILERAGKQGLGTAYIAGFKWGLERSYNYIFEMDADFSHNPNDLIRLRKACIKTPADLSVGSRYVKGGNVENWEKNRVLLSKYASLYVRIITQLPVQDTTAGFVCYTREVLEAMDLDAIRFVGYAFQIEMKYTAHRLGFKLAEVPITFTDRVIGESKMSMKIFKEALWGVFQLRFTSYKRKKA